MAKKDPKSNLTAEGQLRANEPSESSYLIPSKKSIDVIQPIESSEIYDPGLTALALNTRFIAEKEKAAPFGLTLESYYDYMASTSRQGDVDAETTADLIAAAKGDRSLRAFAEAIGINPSTLSRIMNGQTKEISPKLLAGILENADEESGVTAEKLMAAQGLVRNPEKIKQISMLERNYRRVLADILLDQGYDVRYINSEDPETAQIADIRIETNAFSKNKSTWLIECRTYRSMTTSTGRTIFNKWLEKVMTYYYSGGKAGRISFMLDNDSFFQYAVDKLSKLSIPDEISVILASGDGNDIEDEYVAPMKDSRNPKFILVNG